LVESGHGRECNASVPYDVDLMSKVLSSYRRRINVIKRINTMKCDTGQRRWVMTGIESKFIPFKFAITTNAFGALL